MHVTCLKDILKIRLKWYAVPGISRKRFPYKIFSLGGNVLEEFVGKIQLPVTNIVEGLLIRITSKRCETSQKDIGHHSHRPYCITDNNNKNKCLPFSNLNSKYMCIK